MCPGGMTAGEGSPDVRCLGGMTRGRIPDVKCPGGMGDEEGFRMWDVRVE